MQLIMLLAGLVLVIAGSSWFTGATTVGIICLVVFAFITVIQVAALSAASSILGKR